MFEIGNWCPGVNRPWQLTTAPSGLKWDRNWGQNSKLRFEIDDLCPGVKHPWTAPSELKWGRNRVWNLELRIGVSSWSKIFEPAEINRSLKRDPAGWQADQEMENV